MITGLCVPHRHLVTAGVAVVRWHRLPENDIIPVIVYPPTNEALTELGRQLGVGCAGVYYVPTLHPEVVSRLTPL